MKMLAPNFLATYDLNPPSLATHVIVWIFQER